MSATVLNEVRPGFYLDSVALMRLSREIAGLAGVIEAALMMATPANKQIMADAGHVAWDMERYEFLLEPDKINSVHPSMLRMSQLNMNFGLYEVIPGIYQVRGFDLANITFVKGETGWVVFDPLTAPETARAAKELVDEHLGELPVVAVIYSHSHGDHWGGVRGIVD